MIKNTRKCMRKTRLAAIVTAIVICLPLAACGLTGGDVTEASQERIIAVNTAIVQRSEIRTELSFTGQVRASAQVAVISRVQGKVDEVMVHTGDFVNAGDVLFTMDEADIQTNINALVAQLATANAAVRSAQTGVSIAGGSESETAIQTKLLIEQRELGLRQAQMAYEMTLKNFEDAEALFEIGAISKLELDISETSLKNAEITVMQAESGLEQAYSTYSESIRRAQDGLAQAIAQRDSLQVNLDAARERLNDASVTAPISGVISSRNIEPKAMLLTNVAPFTIVSIDTVTVYVNVTETMVNRIVAGQRVNVYVNAASETPFSGKVAVVSPAANEMTAAFSIEISIDNKDGVLRPGMFAEAYFVREESLNTIVIPRSAVLLDEGVTVVYLAENDRAVKREVTLGIDTGTEIEITGGLNTGESLIVKGQTFVRDGTIIHIVESGGEAN